MEMYEKAQGTIEYLVIIAVVVVIALVVVSLLINLANPGTAVVQNAGLIGVKTQPLALMDGLMGRDGKGVFVVQNNTGEMVSIKSMRIDGISYDLGNLSMSMGSQSTFELTDMTPSCIEAQESHELVILYASQYDLDKQADYGMVTIPCEDTVSPTSFSGGGTPGGTGWSFSFTAPAGGTMTGSSPMWNGTGAFTAYDAAQDHGVILDGYAMEFIGASSNAVISSDGTDMIFETS